MSKKNAFIKKGVKLHNLKKKIIYSIFINPNSDYHFHSLMHKSLHSQ